MSKLAVIHNSNDSASDHPSPVTNVSQQPLHTITSASSADNCRLEERDGYDEADALNRQIANSRIRVCYYLEGRLT